MSSIDLHDADRLDNEIIEFGVSFTDVLDALRGGIADGREKDVYDAIDQRRVLRAATVIAQLSVGQRVIARPDTKPAHLAGARGTVVELKPRSHKAVVLWDHRGTEQWTMQGASLIPVPTNAA